MSASRFHISEQFFVHGIVFFFKVIGLLPLKVNIVKGQLVCDVSRFGSIYSILLMLTIFGFNFLSIPFIFNLHALGDSTLAAKLKLTKAIVGTIVLFLTWLIMLFRQKILRHILERFVDVNSELQNSKNIYEMENVKFRLIFFFAINAIIWTGVLSTDMYTYVRWSPVVWISMMTPSFIANWLLIQFSIMLSLIELRFKSINQAMLKLSQVMETSYSNYRELTTMRVGLSSGTVGIIVDIKRMHTKVYEVTNDVANFYSVPLLFVISFFCGTIVYTAYYLVMPIMTQPWDTDVIINTVHVIFTLAMQFFPITVMAVCVNRLTHQMHMTADAVHKLLAWSTPCREVRTELKRFSLELLHRNVEFSAHGVFPLDCSLVHSIISAAVTYLIILVQFQKNPQS